MQITLKSKGYQILVNTLGAELKSYTSPSGAEYVWNSDPAHWQRSSPLLFPAIGNVRNGQTVIKSKIYPMAKHGFCKESEFEIAEQTDSSVTFVLRTSEETLKSYPYHFTLSLSYHLDGSTLSMDYRVVNDDEEKMYYHIGAHPGFMLPVSEGETIKDCILEFEKDENFVSIAYDLEHMEFNNKKRVQQKAGGKILPLSAGMFDNDAVFFEHTNSHQVSLLNKTTKKGVALSYPDFESIAFWTPTGGNAPFLCLEPWNGSAIFHDDDDIFEHKRGILSLDAKQEKNFHLQIDLVE